MSNKRQAQNSTITNYPGFWERLCDVLGTTRTGEIAALLSVSPSLVSDWKAERASPTLVHLFEISKIGGTSVDWLLTGKPPKVVGIGIDDTVTPLPSDTRRTINSIARQTGLEVATVIDQLVHEGLMFRGEVFVWHDDEEIRRGEIKVVIAVVKWMNALPLNEKERFARRMANLAISAVSNSEDLKTVKLESGELMTAEHLGKVNEEEKEIKKRKTN